MNIAGVLLLRYIGSLADSAAAQAAYAVGYTELFSLITWTSVGLMGASATIAGQNLGAGRPERVMAGVWVASRIGLGVAVTIGALFLLVPGSLLVVFGMKDPVAVMLGQQLLRYLALSGLFVSVALCFTGALQGTGDTRSPLYISIVSQIVVPLGILRGHEGDHRPRGLAHLDRDRARPHDALRAQHHDLQDAALAKHYGRTDAIATLIYLSTDRLIYLRPRTRHRKPCRPGL